jgi:hypothetical protein
MASDKLTKIARDSMTLIPESFRLFEIPGVRPPKDPSEWSSFLLANPNYVDGRFRSMAIIIAEDRAVLEGMDEDYQKLGGSVIRVMFSDHELLDLHNGTYWSQ